MDQRMEFVLRFRSGSISMAALCRVFGVSRQTGHKWVNRFSPRRGEASLEELSRRPHHTPTATPEVLVSRIVARRKQFPTWGARKILWLLQLQWPRVRWPAASTVEEILKRHGLVRSRKRRLHLVPRTQPFSHCVEPNDVWCVDFKGQFRTGDGTLVYPLTVTDAASRFLLACAPLRLPESVPTRKVFEELFRKHGLPKAIRCDNGEPFVAARAPAGLSRLSVWWVKLGIRLERIDPPLCQGSCRGQVKHTDILSTVHDSHGDVADDVRAVEEKSRRSHSNFPPRSRIQRHKIADTDPRHR